MPRLTARVGPFFLTKWKFVEIRIRSEHLGQVTTHDQRMQFFEESRSAGSVRKIDFAVSSYATRVFSACHQTSGGSV
jgi:hypothetical protein